MRIAIVGNSGSGKSTLAARLQKLTGAMVLDLDTVAWAPSVGADAAAVPTRRDHTAAAADVLAWCAAAETRGGWIVEGCYADLVAATLSLRPLLLFLNPGIERCMEHCRQRPWEPHKYASAAEQDANLPMLLAWVGDYASRPETDDLSLGAHRRLFDRYGGPKHEITHDAESDRVIAELGSAVTNAGTRPQT
jgi:adenylate kinase family enzyme